MFTSTITDNPQVKPLRLTNQQSRSLVRQLANAGLHVDIETWRYHGRDLPLFVGAPAAAVIGAAHAIPSLAGGLWLKVAIADISDDTPRHGSRPQFCSSLLEWEVTPR